jgi:glucose-6-phosphate 1-dehydrogenase
MATVKGHTQDFENPLVEGLERLPVHPTTLVIFGATGDLAKRKLLPALYNLAHEGAMPERFNLVGIARSEMPDEDYREIAAESIRKFSRRTPDETVLKAFLEQVRYVPGSFDDATVYDRVAKVSEEFDEEAGLPFNRIYYLSTAPQFFETIAGMLGLHELSKQEGADVRIVVEKPFGHDLASAVHLNSVLLQVFEERQIYRIDHYLGKETVQNTLVLRFANTIFEPVWNRSYIDHVQITASEDIALEGRAGYYDNAGALRDLIQNHLLQLLMLTSMEPPVSFTADDIRDEKVKVLHAIDPPAIEGVPQMAVRAQYSAGVIGGKEVKGYLEEEGVRPGSTTETFAAIRLKIDNWRWAGVPFYIRTGKALARKVTEIVVTLKPVPHLAFQHEGSLGVHPNQLILTVQPNEGVSMSLVAKIPGSRMRVRPVQMEFLYGTSFLSQSPEAYERLILDTMRGDATLFARNDEVEAAWAICDPILEAWSRDPGPLPQYPAGSSGPAEQDTILLDDDKWRPI